MSVFVKLLAALLFVSLLSFTAQAQDCVTDMKSFDYISTSPQEFMSGIPEQVRGAYQKLLELVPDPASIPRTMQYFVEIDRFETITSRACDEELCRGMDTLKGLNQCSIESGRKCMPLAALKDGKFYCTLKPNYEYQVNRPPFKPFGSADRY